MLLVSSQMAGYVLDMCDDVVAVKPRINDRVSRMYLKPSYLNDFLQMAEVFENPGIFVKKDGDILWLPGFGHGVGFTNAVSFERYTASGQGGDRSGAFVMITVERQ